MKQIDKQAFKKWFVRVLVAMVAVSGTAFFANGLFVKAQELGTIVTGTTTTTKATQEGCSIKIETVEKVDWKMPRQPIDLVILQDNSGSFKDTIGSVQEALKKLTTPLDAGATYDEKNPKLVFTSNPETTDRVMVNTYRGIDSDISYRSSTYKFTYNASSKYVYVDIDTYLPGYFRYNSYGQKFFYYDNYYPLENLKGSYATGTIGSNPKTSVNDFTTVVGVTPETGADYRYNYKPSALMSSTTDINKAIDSFHTNGGTPTVPAIDDTIAEYNRIKGPMTNNRKTVFLLVTDGVANGYRKVGDPTVYFDRSLDRTELLVREWASYDENGYQVWPEAAQDYIKRAAELKAKGTDLKQKLGNDATVVVGFWEDTKAFTGNAQYGSAYLNRLDSPDSKTTMQTGDPRSIQAVFHEAIESVASPDKILPTGEKASFYVNESDINVFSDKILKAVTSALVKEDVKGDFTITDGYTVDSITLNGKKVVETVTDSTTQIRGTVKQEGNKVTIAVPESVFNPGSNTFDYKLNRKEEPAGTTEANETVPPDNYTPTKVNREVGQLVGTFKVGTYTSAQIGSTTPTMVEVTDLKYCYPRATKDVKDKDSSNDTNGDDGKSGNLAQDPLLASLGLNRPSYAASLSDQKEEFTYTIDYNMYNIPLEMKQNVMFTDQLNYHLQYVDAYVTDQAGNKLTNFTVSTQETKDAKGNATTTVVAQVPKLPGTNNDTIKEGEYGGHKFKTYKLIIKARIKDQYTLENNATEYYKMIQDNNGLGFLNQAAIIWNGNTTAVDDPTSQLRRSNAVYVAPPLKTDVTKEVSQDSNVKGGNHLDLSTRLDDYYYRINSTWPGIFDSYTIEDILVPELRTLNSEGKDLVYVNGVSIPSLTKFIKVEQVNINGETRDRVYLDLQKTSLTRTDLLRINREITAANQGNTGPAVLTLAIKARIKEGASLDRYLDKSGKVLVPNTANVLLNNEKLESNKVTVSPNTPTALKLINAEATHLNSADGQTFSYDVFATLPSDINKATEYVIRDELDDRIELVNFEGTNSPLKMVGTDASDFTTEVVVENGKQVIYSRMKSTSFATVKANDPIHLVVNAKVKSGATGTIDNIATINYNGKPTATTPPVTVTPPPPVTKTVEPTVTERQAGEADGVTEGTYKAVINKAGEDIELAVWNDPYIYKVKSVVPKGAQTFTIEDTLIPEMEMVTNVTAQHPRNVFITVDGAQVEIPANQISVDQTDVNKQKISVSLTEDQIKQYADKEITLSFTAKFKQFASLTKYISDQNGMPKAPNTAFVQVNNNPKVESNKVTVTPPVNKPELKKTVNDTLHADLTGRYEVFKYGLTTSMPYNAKDFVVTDVLEPVLHFTSLPNEVLVTVGEKRYTGTELTDILKIEKKVVNNVEREVVTVTFGAKDIQGNEGKPVNIEFLAQVNNEADLTPYRYVTENHSAKYGTDINHAEIPNTASYSINNTFTQDSNKVTVTPPPPTESKIDKKIEDPSSTTTPKALVTDLTIKNEQDYNYIVDATLPSNIFEYKSWKLEDTLDPRLQLSQTKNPYVETVRDDGRPMDQTDTDYLKEHFKVSVEDATVDGKATKKVVVTVPEGMMKTLHDKYKIRLIIPAQIKAGVTDTQIPNEAIKTGVKPNNDVHVMKPPVVTVNPPQQDPDLNKTIIKKETDGSETKVGHLDVDNEVPYNYEITSNLPTDILNYKNFVITDTLDSQLTALNTDTQKPVISGAAAEFFDVTVEGQKVTATMKNINAISLTLSETERTAYLARAKEALSGKQIALIIPAQINKGVTTLLIENKANLVFTNAVNEEKNKETQPVTVTPPGETPTVDKKINKELTSATVAFNSNYTYNVTSKLPTDITTYKAYAIVDTIDPRLAIQGTPVMAKIDGVDMTQFFDITVVDNKVTATMKNFVNAKALANKTVELVITAHVKLDATQTYPEKPVTVDNKASVEFTNKTGVVGTPVESPTVTVTTPPLTKMINESSLHLDTPTEQAYHYNIKTALPSDIGNYKTFAINDTIDKDLTAKTATIKDPEMAKFFDITVSAKEDGKAQTVTAKITNFEAAKKYAGVEVELVIASQINKGVTRQEIPNQSTVTYSNNVTVDGNPAVETTTPPTPPVTVTPPGETPTISKKINDTLNTAVFEPEATYTYNVKSVLPVDIAKYQKFVISDDVDSRLTVSSDAKATFIKDPEMAKFFTVAVNGQAVTATMKNISDAKALAGKEVELVITAKINKDAKLAAGETGIPNQAIVTYRNKSAVDSDPDTKTPPTPPVNVVPPTLTKKINETLDHLDTPTKTDYKYHIKAQLPTDIANYSSFEIKDTLNNDLAIQGKPVISGEAAKFFEVVVSDQKVTAKITDFKAAEAYAGQEVELVITSQIRDGVVTTNIPNTAEVSFNDKPASEGLPNKTTPPTPPVTVTPPTVTKKINENRDQLAIENGKEYTYNIKTTLSKAIASFKKFEITDSVDKDLTVIKADIKNEAMRSFFTVTVPEKVAGQGQIITAAINNFTAAAPFADQEVELIITAKINDGITRASIPNTTKVIYNNSNVVDVPDLETPPTPPVTVTPPGEVPTVEKTINGSLTEAVVEPESNYTYNITATLPRDIATYKIFSIVDTLDVRLSLAEGVKPTIKGEAAKFFTVDVSGQKVIAKITDFKAAAAYASKSVELVIPAQLNKDAKLAEGEKGVPNVAKVTYQNQFHADGTPDSETPSTPPVTVTPPTLTKKINESIDHLDIDTGKDYNYNIKTSLPSDITSYQTFVINDTLAKELDVKNTPIIKGEAAKFFDVNVDGQKVTATMKDFAKAGALAGKEVELVITAQIRSGETRQNIPNQATMTYTNKVDADGNPGTTTTTPPTPPVTVTPPGENPTVTKLINKTEKHLDVDNEKDYTYNIKAVLPNNITRYTSFVIVDDIDSDLVVQGQPVIEGSAKDFFDVKVDGQKVTATMKDFVKAGALAGKEVELVITAQIKAGVTRQNIPNTTKVVYNRNFVSGTPGTDGTTPPPGTNTPPEETPSTPPVTVTPPGETPTVSKKINDTESHLDIDTEKDYTYNIKSTLPVDIAKYKAFTIVDTLDKDLAIQGTPVIKGSAKDFFDVNVDGQKVTATMKDFAKAGDLAGKEVELVITAQIREGVTRQNIPNTTKVVYNRNFISGTPGTDGTTPPPPGTNTPPEETPPTPPVTVTPPGENPTVTKLINKTEKHLDVDNEKDYTYNIKAVLPNNITRYTSFVIVDDIDSDLVVQGQPVIEGSAKDFFDVKVDGQKVTATMKDFVKAGALAGKEVELVITAQIKAGVTRQNIPNTTKVVYNRNFVSGTPGTDGTTPPPGTNTPPEETPSTPPVTVTPPGETPTVSKKINDTESHLDIDTEKDYTYNIKSTLPVDIAKYKAFTIVDTLDKDLAIQGTPVIKGSAKDFFDVNVDGQKVTATMKDFAKAGDLAGKEVELVITAQIREGVTRQNIPNTAKVTYQNKSHVDGTPDTETPSTPPVTVTPPTPNTPPLEKKVNGADKANLAERQEVFTYTLDTTMPTGAFAFDISDTLENVLTVDGAVKATLAGKTVPAEQITVKDQKVTITFTKDQVKSYAGKAIHVTFAAKVKDGADLTPYMVNGPTSIPNTANYIINNDPNMTKDSNTVPVLPPTPTEPGIDKKINKTLEHLDIERNTSYMYNVNAALPNDISTYKNFVITDNLEDVLTINGEVVVLVDGYQLPESTFVKSVDGNKVTVTVKDFAALKGYKQIQVYIPANIKTDADLSKYADSKVPNTAHLAFTNSNGIDGSKDTVPVTVTPPGETPPTPVNPPTPGKPVKTVSGVDGDNPTYSLRLGLASDAFRFDIKSVVPQDMTKEKRQNITSITIKDRLDNNLKVTSVALKITGQADAISNFIDEDYQEAKKALDEAKAKLEEITKATGTVSQEQVTQAKAKVASLETQVKAVQSKLAELKVPDDTAPTTDSTAPSGSDGGKVLIDKSAEIAAQEKELAALTGQLNEAKQALEAASKALNEAKTPAEIKVEADNQQKVIAKAQEAFDKAKEKKDKVDAKTALLAKVTENGELTKEALTALGGKVTISADGQTVTVDISDEATMEALKGYTVSAIIYAKIKDVTALKDVHFKDGILNTAEVQFNHDPSQDMTKKTNTVKVTPPKPEGPKPQTPPTGKTPPKHPTPKTPGKPVLPRTGDTTSLIGAAIGTLLLGLGFVELKRKES
ncbi:isopeptide-forming domain-containing fimbrial protein [Streptococcus iniae]|uniref:isopeptide-forming domain-containing fimbrial protein n=3 Tax=Streptococcus iniae TaxID=1346 RepID=UPI00202F4E98|nr:isopeptide-forming domain-containing fimbrial protein [Streptococcus iniae]MCM0723095.1 isopeptide-forming domain-containing fimbrial protein [Streptococcus iniae]